jgi:hypothetical protein
MLIGIPLASVASMMVLGTSFIKGIVIALIQGILTVIIAIVLVLILPNAAM